MRKEVKFASRWTHVPSNQREVRFAVADPIAKMICQCWRYQVANAHAYVWTSVKATLAPTDEARGDSRRWGPQIKCRRWWSGVRHDNTKEDNKKFPFVDSRTPGSKVSGNIFGGSRADYSIYTIKNHNEAVMALLMEAKMTFHSKFKHAVAQVKSQFSFFGWWDTSSCFFLQLLRYYIKFSSDKGTPPLCILLSEMGVNSFLPIQPVKGGTFRKV